MTTARAGGFAILVWVATLVSACASEAKDDLGLATTTTDRVTTTERPTTTTEAPTTTTVLPVEPQTFDGAGPAVLDVDKPIDPMLAYVKANDAGRYCGVKTFGETGDQIAQLVNTTDSYEGVTPVDFLDGERTTRIQVECEGNWHIELRPLESLAIVEAGATRAHRGDDVFAVRSPDTATITGNGESRYFGVRAYVAEDSPAGLVNTTDPYQGEVILPRDDVVIIEVTAVGDWIYTNNAT